MRTGRAARVRAGSDGPRWPATRSAFALSALQFLSDDAAQNGLEGFLSLLDECAQRIVDQRLIVPSAGRVDLVTKPLEQIVVEANRDAGLARGRRDYRR